MHLTDSRRDAADRATVVAGPCSSARRACPVGRSARSSSTRPAGRRGCCRQAIIHLAAGLLAQPIPARWLREQATLVRRLGRRLLLRGEQQGLQRRRGERSALHLSLQVSVGSSVSAAEGRLRRSYMGCHGRALADGDGARAKGQSLAFDA
jgi:hypothetical protein